MESVNRKIMLIAVIMALFTSFLVYIYIKKATTKTEVIVYTDVYVAVKTLPARHKITEDDIRQIKVTAENLNKKAVLRKSDIVGKLLKDRIIEGEQILADRLAGAGDASLSYSIPAGKRAVSINANEQLTVSNLIRPGDFVDVIASFEKEEYEDSSRKLIYPRVTRTILENVEVLSLGQDLTVTDQKIKEPPKTVVLAVEPQQAEKLVYASEYAVLRLALRPVGDDAAGRSDGTVRNDMVTERGVIILPK